MTIDRTVIPAWQTMTEEQTSRWDEVLNTLAALVPSGDARVLVGGGGDRAAVVDRLADRLHATGRRCVRLTGDAPLRDGTVPGTVTLADGCSPPPEGGWGVTIWLRTAHHAGENGEHPADIVLDLHDGTWPVIRHIASRLAGHADWYTTENRAFFAARAATWDTKFGDDTPAYTSAVTEAAISTGATVLDAGCGTGRALPALRASVGPAGTVIGLDITPQMLTVAKTAGRAEHAQLLLADARRIPLADASLDAVFAAGLVPHLPDLTAGLAELARITRPGGRLAVFHPSGRVALAARHGHTPRPDDPLAESHLVALLDDTGWRLDTYDDPPHRFLVLASRHPHRRRTVRPRSRPPAPPTARGR